MDRDGIVTSGKAIVRKGIHSAVGRAVDTVICSVLEQVANPVRSTTRNRSSAFPSGQFVELLEGRRLLDATASTTSLLPEADAQVQGGAANASLNFGTQTSFMVKDDPDVSRDREAYLRFDLSSLDDLSPTDVTAKLRLKTTAVGTAVAASRYRIELLADANDNWSESGITYANRPTANTTVVTQWQGLGVAAGNGYVELDVSTAVRKTLAADPNRKLSLRIVGLTPGYEGAVTFASREDPTAANRPQLLVQDGTLYFNDFMGSAGGAGTATGVGATWNSSTISTTPTGGRKFLGDFGNETATLNLTSLPAHAT